MVALGRGVPGGASFRSPRRSVNVAAGCWKKNEEGARAGGAEVEEITLGWKLVEAEVKEVGVKWEDDDKVEEDALKEDEEAAEEEEGTRWRGLADENGEEGGGGG